MVFRSLSFVSFVMSQQTRRGKIAVSKARGSHYPIGLRRLAVARTSRLIVNPCRRLPAFG